MLVRKTAIPDVYIIKPKLFEDDRGFFMETFQADEYAMQGIPGEFVQDNHSGSMRGVLRGLHYQIRQVQGKLVQVVVGEIFDVAVDIRRSSHSFGKWIGQRLSVENKLQLWIPPGFAHGFYVLSDWAEVIYKTTNFYAPGWERTIHWNDPEIGIDWPLIDGKLPILSEKDSQGERLQEAEIFE